MWSASRPRSLSSSSTSRNESEYRRYQRTAHRISSGSVCRHLKIAGRIAFFMISSAYQPLSAKVATQPARIMPEFGSRRKVDLAIQSRGETVLLELKTFPTNYGAGGKPITNFIDSVIADLEKLSEERGGRHWSGSVVGIPNPRAATQSMV